MSYEKRGLRWGRYLTIVKVVDKDKRSAPISFYHNKPITKYSDLKRRVTKIIERNPSNYPENMSRRISMIKFLGGYSEDQTAGLSVKQLMPKKKGRRLIKPRKRKLPFIVNPKDFKRKRKRSISKGHKRRYVAVRR